MIKIATRDHNNGDNWKQSNSKWEESTQQVGSAWLLSMFTQSAISKQRYFDDIDMTCVGGGARAFTWKGVILY